MTSLHSLKPASGSRKKPRRVGRGESSGWGKTSGRGHKGQKSRSGANIPPWFEGGQMPLTRRVPKRGFTNVNRVSYTAINLDRLQNLKLDESAPVTPEVLKEIGCINDRKPLVKILGRGELTKPLEVHAHAFSKSASDKIIAAGGKVEVIIG